MILFACIFMGATLVGCASQEQTAVPQPPEKLARVRIYGPEARTIVLWPDGSGAVLVGEFWRRARGFPPGTFDTREVLTSLREVAGTAYPLAESNPPTIDEHACHVREYLAGDASAQAADVSRTEAPPPAIYYAIPPEHRERVESLIDRAMSQAARVASQ